jgi:hypothetical protein
MGLCSGGRCRRPRPQYRGLRCRHPPPRLGILTSAFVDFSVSALTHIFWTWCRTMWRGGARRLPLWHPARVHARDAKLLRRELAGARSRGHRRILCPCRVCNRGVRTEYALRTVATHVHQYDYHEWQRGSTKVIIFTPTSLMCTSYCFFPSGHHFLHCLRNWWYVTPAA